MSKREWKVGERCWFGNGVWNDPRRSRVVMLTATHAVIMDDGSTCPSVVRLETIARTKTEALAPGRAEALVAAKVKP